MIITQNTKIKEILYNVAEVAKYLWDRSWAERNPGNISVNINHLINDDFEEINDYPVFELPEKYPQLAKHYFFVTGTGKRMRDLARSPLKNALIIKISDDGNSYYLISKNKEKEPGFMPTSELPTHLAIHQQIKTQGGKEKVILHAHALELIALTHSPDIKTKDDLNKIIWGMHPETMTFIPRGVGFVPYTVPGSVEIAKKTLEEFKNHNVVLWEKHGVFAIGSDVFETFDNVDIVSKSAKIWFMCKQAGFEPEGLTEKQLDELYKTFVI